MMKMTLFEVAPGFNGQVEEIKESNKKKRHFLKSIGCTRGESLALVSKLSGNYIIGIQDSRYAIDEKMAKKIFLAKEKGRD
jgi:Fe2+ transport system protein FeoA